MRRAVAWAVGIVVLLAGCDDCDLLTVERVRSPDERHDAVVYSAICGFLVGSNTAVSITPPGEEPKNEPAPFYAIWHDFGGDRTLFGGPAVDVRWRSADTLQIRYRHSALVKRAEARAAGVTILHEITPDGQRTPAAPRREGMRPLF